MPPEDNPAPEPGASTPAAPATPAAPSEPTRLPDDHPLVKAYQATKQSLAEAKDKLKGYEDADKSEIEKLTDKVTAAEQRAQAAEVKLLRQEVAADKGLTPAQAKRLVGTTREELEADADEILEAFGAPGTPGQNPPPSRQPKSALAGGLAPSAEGEETDPRKLAARHSRSGF